MVPQRRGPRSYFTEFTVYKAVFYSIAAVYVLLTSIVVMVEPLISLSCDLTPVDAEFANPIYVDDPCRRVRMARLLFLTQDECDFGRRLVMSVLFGGIIGWERRQSERPAGIRTMSLVSLGSCLFSICSAFAFLSGPMEWDASRVSAAIPSGVGFLGAGLIFKQQTGEEDNKTHVVHGLTTAASVWLSAAVGIACGGELYFVACYCVAIMLLVLRFGPRLDDDNLFGFDQAFVDPEMQPLNASFRRQDSISSPTKAPQLKS